MVLVLDYIAKLEKGITLERLELLLLSPTTRTKFALIFNITFNDYVNVIVDVFVDSDWSFDIERQMESCFTLVTQVLQEPIVDEERKISS